MITKRLLLAASLALIVGCGKDSTGPTGLNGQMGFTFSGALSGTFNVTGQMPTNPSALETSSWAAGDVQTSGSDAGIIAVATTPRTASSHDYAIITVNRTTAGSDTIDPSNCATVVCTEVIAVFGVTNGSGASWLQDCVLLSGSITVTEVTSSRIRGTFSGDGECTTPTATSTSFTITNGTFDVPIVASIS